MKNFGQQFKDLFTTFTENVIHPHASVERANLFSSMDMGSTEVETINFINAIAYCFKPAMALETGTYLGCGTIAIAQALEANGLGKLITMDVSGEFLAKAIANVKKAELSHRVEFIQDTSFNVIKNHKGPPFDMVFFDSEANRKDEFNLVVEKKLFAKNAICIFHDTSANRHLTFKADPEYTDFLNELLDKYEGFCFPFLEAFISLE